MSPTLNNRPDYHIPKDIKRQLLRAKQIIRRHNSDRFYIIDGREGSGKSTLALQFASYIDPTFSLDDVTFDAETFAKRIRECKKYKAIVFDEGFNGLSSKGALSKVNKDLVRLLMECRQRNLFIIIVLPSIFLLEKYIAIFRSQGLFHVANSKRNYSIRYYKVYNYENKKKLYVNGKNFLSYSKPKLFKFYRFYGKFPPSIDPQAYVEKKLKAFKDDKKVTLSKMEEKYKERFEALIKWVIKEYNVTHVKLEKAFTSCNPPLTSTNLRQLYPKNAIKREMLNTNI